VAASFSAWPFAVSSFDDRDGERTCTGKSARRTFFAGRTLGPPRGRRSGTWLQDQQRELALCPITLQKRAAAVSFARKQLGVPSPISSAWARRPTTLSIDLFGLIVSATFPAGSVTGKYHERPQAYGRCDSIESRRYLSRAHNARRIRRESIHLGDLQPRWRARAPQIEEDFPNADRGSLRLDGKRGPAGVERGGRISLS